jgi:glycosyltransferase A (GT-A) superfamily protein (DUF2064 family)
MTDPVQPEAVQPDPAQPEARLLVLAKAPVAGRSKTRLTPCFSAIEAAELAEAALRDTLGAVAEAAVLLHRAGVDVETVLVLDGVSGDWLPPSFRVVDQVDGGLDVRLAAAFADAAPLPCLLVGMDTPQVPAELLAQTVLGLCDETSEADASLGPAADGGWWALGFRTPRSELLEGLPMSTPHTCAATERRLREAGLVLDALPVLTDVDTAQDAALVAAQAPWSAFAHRYRSLREMAS